MGDLEQARGWKVVERAAEKQNRHRADDGDKPPAALEDAQRVFAVVASDHHGHLVAGDAAEASVGKTQIAGDGAEDHPLAVERGDPEVEEDGDLDELDDDGGYSADPTGEEAEEQPTLCGAIHTHVEEFSMVLGQV